MAQAASARLSLDVGTLSRAPQRLLPSIALHPA